MESTNMTRLLQEIKYPYVVLPGVRVPRHFHQRANQESISFWIRKKLPNISVSFALLPHENLSVELCISVGRFKATLRRGYFLRSSCYVLLFCLPSALTPKEYQSLEGEIEEDWVQVELFGVIVDKTSSKSYGDEISSRIIKECGVHVRIQGGSDNISFSNLCNQGSLMDHTNVNELKKPEDLKRIPFSGQRQSSVAEGKEKQTKGFLGLLNPLKKYLTRETQDLLGQTNNTYRQRWTSLAHRKGMRWLDEDFVLEKRGDAKINRTDPSGDYSSLDISIADKEILPEE